MGRSARDGAAPDPADTGGARLGLTAAIALVMGNMIGSGVFLLPASLAPFGWNATIAWSATILGSLVLALVFARLARSMPAVGGAAGFAGAAFGPLPAFLVAWIYLVSVWTGIVAIAVAAVSYMSSLVPVLSHGTYRTAMATLGLVWGLTLVNLGGARAAGRLQSVTLLIKVVPLLLVIVIAAIVLARGTGSVAHAGPAVTLSRVNGAGALTLWALLGFECASLAAARVKRPQVNVPRATMWGTGLAGGLYLLVCSAISLMLPAAEAAASPAPFATFVARYWSAGAAQAVAVFAIISCIGALNGWVLLQGELPRDMAARGWLPPHLARTDARGTPRRGLLVSSAIVSVLVLMNASKSMQAMFDTLLLTTAANLWFYLAVALAALRLGIARKAAALGALYALWTLWGAGLEASASSLVLMGAGYPVWWWTRRSAIRSARRAISPPAFPLPPA